MKRPTLLTVVRFAALASVGLLACGLAFGGCTLKRYIPPPHQTITASVTVRNVTDGRTAVVGHADMTLDPGAAPVSFPELTTDDELKAWFARYLHRRLGAARMTPTAMFNMTFGQGSEWCLVDTPGIGRGPVIEGAFTPADLLTTESALQPCDAATLPMPTECRNEAGATPALSLPTPYDFGNQPVGIDSGWRPVVLTNAGTGRLCLALPGPLRGPGFFAEAGTCAPDPADPEETHAGRRLLASGESCALNVRFEPQRPGSLTDTLPITSNDPTPMGPSLVLRGNGVGGTLTVSAIDDRDGAITDPGDATGRAIVCIDPYDEDPAHYRPYIQIRNDGEGIVTLRSLPSDTAWGPLSDFWILDPVGVLRRPPGAEAPPNVPRLPLVLGVGEQLRFGGIAVVSPAPPTGRLVFSGNQQNSPFTISVVPAAACP